MCNKMLISDMEDMSTKIFEILYSLMKYYLILIIESLI